jgi:signal transduction histidine kinase
VRQIVNNLLANAVKYSLSSKRIDVAIRTTAATVELDVVDWGIGIASEELPRIFNRFHRADSAAAAGHGLGLFIASVLTLLHGGSLNVKSELGKGSTFTLALPRKTS